MNTGEVHDDSSKPQPKLSAALRDLQANPVFVPPALDAAILARARSQFNRSGSQTNSRVRLAPWLALAAALAALASLLLLITPSRRSAETAAYDVNRDGRLDILDAFALARQLEAGSKPSAMFDFNHDGRVDNRDVQALAALAVQLERNPKL